MLKTLVWEGYHRAGANGADGAVETNGHFRELDDPSLISECLAAGDQLIWLDLSDPTPEEMALVAGEFGLHPLAVEDAGKGNQRPKIDPYDTFYFMVVYALEQIEEAGPDGRMRSTGRFRIQEVDLFIGERYLITVHRAPLAFLDQLGDRWRKNSQAINEGIGVLVYTLLDGIVDEYFPVLDSIIERVEELEEVLFTGVVHEGRMYDMRSLFQIKRDLLNLRRVIAPERDALLVLARQEIHLFDRKIAVYFQDVYDHVVRVTDAIDIYQDLLTNALESYLSLVNNNLNQVMKTLTSLTVMLVVPTLIAGIYGMNFDNMPELHWEFGYPFALLLMALSAGTLFYYFRRKRWL
ncbi:MAG TPA: magnesium/cobalt transporter CorA [Chloroflexota bacterium]|nr:magnesium/cobalt transporter CorA [Chloroflexota bacterium]